MKRKNSPSDLKTEASSRPRRKPAPGPLAGQGSARATMASLASAPASPFVIAYLRFLSRVTQADENQPEPSAVALEPNERALLEWVILRWAEQRPLTVRQAIAHTFLGSPATLHKRLVQLRQKSYLQIEDVPGDKRAKHLVPGLQGLGYLERMGRHLVNTRRSANPGGALTKH